MNSKHRGAFKEFQFGTLLFAFFIPTYALLTYLYINHVGTHPMDLSDFLYISIGFVIASLLFFRMTTRVDDENIVVSFGIGIIRKKIATSNVGDVKLVKTPWYYGWGIRFFPDGMLYNMSGNKGIELELKDRKRRIRIGSQNPALLKEEILKRQH
jgi:hypothetical protein